MTTFRSFALTALAALSTSAFAGPADSANPDDRTADAKVERTITTSRDGDTIHEEIDVTIEKEVVVVDEDGTVTTGDFGLLEALGLSFDEFDFGFEVAMGKGEKRQVVASFDFSDPENPDVSAPEGAEVVVETKTTAPSLDELAKLGVPQDVIEKLQENGESGVKMITTVEVATELPEPAE